MTRLMIALAVACLAALSILAVTVWLMDGQGSSDSSALAAPADACGTLPPVYGTDC